MQKLKKVIAVFFSLILLFSLASCSLETEQGNKIKAQCVTLIDAFIAGDSEAAYAVFVSEMDKEEFLQSFPVICQYLEGVETYELTQTGWHAEYKNGVSGYEATFAMKTNIGDFQITAVEIEGYEGIYNFNIAYEEDLNPSFTGTITTLAGSNPLQIFMLLLSAVCLAFVIVMLVDCCKHKMKYKPLWIILILCGMIAFKVSFSEEAVNFNTNISLTFFAYSYLKIYETGAFVFNLLLPAGALIYLIFRKKILASSAAVKEEDPASAITEQTSETAEKHSESADKNSAENGQ